MRLRSSAAALLLVVSGTLSACSVVGYPSPVTPPAPDGAAREGDAVEAAGRASREPVGPAGLVPEPLARYGNPEEYEVRGRTYRTLASAEGFEEEGLASWYGDEFAGRPTSSREIFDPELLTAAHRRIPIPAWVEVVNLRNGRSVVVRVNDRGPFADPERRIIDLSEAAARELDMIGEGVVPVRIRVLVAPTPPGAPPPDRPGSPGGRGGTSPPAPLR